MFTLALGQGETTPGASSGWIGEFRFLADQQGLNSAVGRTPDADLLPVINDCYRALREQVTQWGYTEFLDRGTTTALPVVPFEVGESYATITTAVGLTQIKAIDAKLTSGDWRRLTEVTFLQLRDRYNRPSAPGYPHLWCWLSAGTVSGSTYTGGRIALAPVPNGGSYVLWSLQEATPVALTTDVFLYHTVDWKMWHMMQVLVRVCGIRDKNTRAQVDIVLRELDPAQDGTVAQRIKSQAPTASGPKTWSRSNDYRGGRGPWG